MKFTKPATSITDQLALLRRRGMVIDDEASARHYLQHISYYRLRAYWLTYETPAAAGDHAFRPGTRFEDVLALYVFDRQLRLLVMDAIERVEVALRAGWAQPGIDFVKRTFRGRDGQCRDHPLGQPVEIERRAQRPRPVAFRAVIAGEQDLQVEVRGMGLRSAA